jgi:hypothetical protein
MASRDASSVSSARTRRSSAVGVIDDDDNDDNDDVGDIFVVVVRWVVASVRSRQKVRASLRVDSIGDGVRTRIRFFPSRLVANFYMGKQYGNTDGGRCPMWWSRVRASFWHSSRRRFSVVLCVYHFAMSKTASLYYGDFSIKTDFEQKTNF